MPHPLRALTAVALALGISACGDSQDPPAAPPDGDGDGAGSAIAAANEDALLRAVKLRPSDAEAHYRLGVARYEASVVHLGASAIDREKLEQSLASFNEAIRLKPDVAAFHLQRGLALARGHDLEGAAECYQRALALDPKLAVARVHLGQAYLHFERPVDGLAELRRAAKDAPGLVIAHEQLALAALELGEFDAAAKAFQAVIDLRPDEIECWYGLSTALRRLGRAEDADAALAEHRRRIAARDGAPTAEQKEESLRLLRAAAEDLRAGRKHEARVALDAALKLTPRSSNVHAHLGLVQVAEGQREAARASFERAIELYPTNELAHCELGALLAEEGEIARAKSHLRATLAANPNHARARDLLARIGGD